MIFCKIITYLYLCDIIKLKNTDKTMKSFCFMWLVVLSVCLLVACGSKGTTAGEAETPEVSETPDTPQLSDFARGADISWLTEMEADGVKFHKADGTEADCFDVLKEAGVDAIRLRVWVDSSKSPYKSRCCDKESVVGMALRAKKKGMDVMIDFHYSNWFADPSRQETPADWNQLDLNGLKQAVATHTNDVLTALKAAGVAPKWIQVGNETRPGMLHPVGQLYNKDGNIEGGWKNYVALSNAGYESAKKICPEAMVMIHIDNAWDTETNSWWLEEFNKNGGKTDMIALSHYPQTHPKNTWEEMNKLACGNVKAWAQKYNIPIMISEVGVKPETGQEAIKTLKHFMELMHHQSESVCKGVFYWEPQVYGGWKPACYNDLGWPSYNMGGFDANGKAGEIMKALTATY